MQIQENILRLMEYNIRGWCETCLLKNDQQNMNDESKTTKKNKTRKNENKLSIYMNLVGKKNDII